MAGRPGGAFALPNWSFQKSVDDRPFYARRNACLRSLDGLELRRGPLASIRPGADGLGAKLSQPGYAGQNGGDAAKSQPGPPDYGGRGRLESGRVPGLRLRLPSAKIRLEQLEEAVVIVKRLWTEPGPVSFQGQYYHISDAYCEPRPNPVPTLLVGGGGRTTIGLAARCADWWNLPDANFEKLQSRLPIIQEQCERVGRDPASLRLTWFGRLAVARSEGKALALSNGKWTKERALVGTPELVVTEMQRFIEAGVDYFMMEILGLANPETKTMVLEAVLPRVKAEL
jgi:alkanesulfonate monooxygenase SsuD/methylene tetrahydromethanopterin reductase-like flavin-dependent oxidoreductase (luciferase family)